MKKIFLSTILVLSLFSGTLSAYTITDFRGTTYEVDLSDDATALDLRNALAAQKEIPVEKVVLVNIPDPTPVSAFGQFSKITLIIKP